MKLFLEKSHQLNLVNYFCKTTPSLTFERDLNAPPHIPENLLVLCQKPETFNMERFAKLVDGFQLLTIFSKRSILDAQHGSEYTSGFQISDVRHESKRTYSFFTNADIKSFKRQLYKMVKHTQTIRLHLSTNCLSVFDHFVRLALNSFMTEAVIIQKPVH